jgi:tRNA pseudouridine55 synthase
VLGILLIDKPLGITSHDVVARIRRKFQTKRVGHAGTLDPLATGLLVVAIGPATRFLQYMPLEPKEYIAEIAFGEETTTQDREGEVVSRGEVPRDLPAAFAAAVPQFLGLIDQLPPLYSAVKKEGKPLYAYARKGEEVDRESRRVHIGRFEALSFNESKAEAIIECSGGTYVRTLAHDMGRSLGCGAHLSALKRTRVGRFSLDEAASLDEVSEIDLISLRDALIPPLPAVVLNARQVEAIRHGQAIAAMGVSYGADPVVLLDSSEQVIGMARARDGELHPECVIPSPNPEV